MDSWKHKKKEGNRVLLIPRFWADNIGSKRNAVRLYLLLTCQTVCCKILHGDLPWLTHVQKTEIDSPISICDSSWLENMPEPSDISTPWQQMDRSSHKRSTIVQLYICAWTNSFVAHECTKKYSGTGLMWVLHYCTNNQCVCVPVTHKSTVRQSRRFHRKGLTHLERQTERKTETRFKTSVPHTADHFIHAIHFPYEIPTTVLHTARVFYSCKVK